MELVIAPFKEVCFKAAFKAALFLILLSMPPLTNIKQYWRCNKQSTTSACHCPIVFFRETGFAIPVFKGH